MQPNCAVGPKAMGLGWIARLCPHSRPSTDLGTV